MSTDSTEIPNIRLLGDPVLRAVATPVDAFADVEFEDHRRRLCATLLDFRRRNNFGRAISAPQIGYSKRLIAMNLNGESQIIVNPEITWESSDRITMWDDCMSFPSLLVRLERARSISIHFQNEAGEHRDWDHLDTPTSELLQHEIDHLNGVLAIDRAIDKNSIVMRETYLGMPDHFRRQVDYEIETALTVE